MKMMAIVALPILLLSQMVFANPTYKDVAELVELLDEDKRAVDYDESMYIRVCNQDPIELGLVIDSSVSIPKRDFETGQHFLSSFLEGYDIGPGKKQVRVSAVTFGRGVYDQDSFNLNTYKSKEQVKEHVTHMPFRYGTRTDTGDAIKYMREKQMTRARPSVPKIAIVLTDGNSQRRSWTKDQARMARETNITVFAVGVGRSVSTTELYNIAGDMNHVIRASSYEDLKDIKKALAYKTCVLKPRPTTTTTTTTTTPIPTTTPPADEPCNKEYPSDINFIFSPAALGLDATGTATQIITHTISDEELESGFQYGVVTGDCPMDEGFALNDYSDKDSIQEHLKRYDSNNLSKLVKLATKRAFTSENGAREDANQIAVIFLGGQTKIHMPELSQRISEMQAAGITVFVSTVDEGVSTSGLPEGVTVLGYGSSQEQAEELVSHICHLDEE